MKTEIIKPFDLAKAKAGAKLRTKSGHPVEIFKWDARGDYPIQGMIVHKDKDICASWNSEGGWFNEKEGIFNLVIVEEVESSEFWSDYRDNTFNGFIINTGQSISKVVNVPNIKLHRNVFATKMQARSALAMSRISQIMANDIENFGGVVTDIEWSSDERKFVIYRDRCHVDTTVTIHTYHFLAFHTAKQRNLFLKKYSHLVRDYLMIL